MKQRLITAGIGLCIVVPIFFLSHTYAWELFIALVNVLGVFELLRAVKLITRWELSVCSVLYAAAVPLLSGREPRVAFDLTVLYLCIMLFLGVVVHRPHSADKVCLGATFTVYVVITFSSMVFVRRLESGVFLFMLVFVGAWMTDSFAYFVGRFFGKHKLCPKLSPKKTREGAVGGWLGCIVCFLIYGLIIESLSDKTADYLGLAVTGAVAGIVSQLGDLLLSALKRQVNLKDFSNILPGHGGVLDRFDSVMAVSAFLYLLVTRVSLFY